MMLDMPTRRSSTYLSLSKPEFLTIDPPCAYSKVPRRTLCQSETPHVQHLPTVPTLYREKLLSGRHAAPKCARSCKCHEWPHLQSLTVQRVLADLLISVLETELCRLNTWGLPVMPDESITISTKSSFTDLIDIDFPLDTPEMTDPLTPPQGWEATFEQGPLDKISTEVRHFVLPTTPYTISQVSLFTPLRDVLDPTSADPSTPSHILNLPQPEMFCADANDHANPMVPTTHDGWEPFVWNGEKHFWISSTVGARIRVEIKVNAGRVAVYYYRSRHYDLGDALCWVDDNERGAVSLAGHWTKQYNVAV